MHTDLTDSINLCVYGTRYLHGKISDDFVQSYEPLNLSPIVQFRTKGILRKKTIESVLEWFKILKGRGVRRITLRVVRDGQVPAISTGFFGNPQWFIVTEGKRYQWWYGGATVGRYNNNGKWGKYEMVAYEHVRTTSKTLPILTTRVAKNQLMTVLKKLLVFSRDYSPHWTKTFRSAIRVLSTSPKKSKDALPVPSQQLLSAVDKAWVFGGMSSWTDENFSDAKVVEEYERLTDELYNALLRALESAVERATS